MTKYVEWPEPYGDGAETVILRMSFADIASARRRAEPRYESDEQAIEDFLVVHWGKVVVVDDDVQWSVEVKPNGVRFTIGNQTFTLEKTALSDEPEHEAFLARLLLQALDRLANRQSQQQ